MGLSSCRGGGRCRTGGDRRGARRRPAAVYAKPAARGPQAHARVRRNRPAPPSRAGPCRRDLCLHAVGRAAGQPPRSADRHRMVASLGPRPGHGRTL
ncbi:hypothetical protein G6F60_015531 [Rhizopus arrhizus]|nr:hypothetical protein G6F60_015531 [Rhizopus arrhizus]